MPASIKVVVTGIRRIDKVLRTLPLKVQKKVVRQAMRAGMKTMAQAVKAEAPVDKGVLRRNINVRAVKRRKRGTIEIEVRVNPDRTKKKSAATGQEVFYPATVQYGRRGVPPDPFMTRAYTGSARAARDVTMQMMLDGVNREAKAP